MAKKMFELKLPKCVVNMDSTNFNSYSFFTYQHYDPPKISKQMVHI